MDPLERASWAIGMAILLIVGLVAGFEYGAERQPAACDRAEAHGPWERYR